MPARFTEGLAKSRRSCLVLSLVALGGLTGSYILAAPPETSAKPVPEGMISIPAGKAILGTSPAQRERLIAEYGIHPDLVALQTARTVDVPAFFIDRCEVTNRQYRDFVEATGHRLPIPWLDTGYPARFDDEPIVGIDFQDAVAFAQWAGKRLPTEDEWEKAARGTDGRLWPWGNEWDAHACRCDDSHGGPMRCAPDRVGSHPQDRSPYGVMDMAGNVIEWVQGERTAGSGDTAMLRGGGFQHASPVKFLCATRVAHPTNHGNVCYIGFRCALDATAVLPPRRSESTIAPTERVPVGTSPLVRAPLAPDPSQYGKRPIQLFPVFDLDPGLKRYRNTMSAYMPVSKTGKDALPRPTPCRVEVHVPYLPGDRFNIFFENLWNQREAWIPQFNADFTVARLKGRTPNGQVDLEITVSGRLDSVDILYNAMNRTSRPAGGFQEMCFNALFAPNFRDHDGTRTLISTDEGLQPIAAEWHHVNDRLWLQGYDVGEKPPKGRAGSAIRGPFITTVSRDGKWLIAPVSLSGPPTRLFNNGEYSCLHCYLNSAIGPGERRLLVQKIYFLQGTPADLAARYKIALHLPAVPAPGRKPFGD